VGQQRSVTRVLLWAGVFGPVLFVIVVLVAGALVPDYDPVHHFVSLLAIGQNGWLQTLNFVISGALIAGFGLALARAWPSDRVGRTASIAIGVGGAGLILAGFLPTDPGQGFPPGAPAGLPTETSWHAAIHYLGALLFFLGIPAAEALIGRRAWRNGQRTFAAYSVTSGLAMLLLDSLALTLALVGGAGADIAGLVQRASIVSGCVALAVIALTVIARWPELQPYRLEAADTGSTSAFP
jgi:hypothetical membrane protein